MRSLLGSSRFTADANLVISEPRSRNAVPFYLQPTLGGGDIHNEVWLRSYTSYRFTAPNTVAYSLTYERRLIDPFGFSIFAEWGKVGANPGDLDFDHLKHSVGFSLSLRLGGRAVAEISFAWGGGEGYQARRAIRTTPSESERGQRGAWEIPSSQSGHELLDQRVDLVRNLGGREVTCAGEFHIP